MSNHSTQIGHYEIHDVLARGGMGVIYRARHLETHQEVALKTLRVLRERAIKSIRREVHTLSGLRHPGIVRLVSHGLHEGLPWYAMELLQGKTLRERFKELGSNPRLDGAGVATAPEPTAAGGHLPEVLTIICRLCQILAYLHGEGLVHRDLKPDNILVRDDGVPTIIDFGIVWRFAGAAGREVLEVEQAVAGTADFMAPEQIMGLELDARADLYALGCILFTALCGRPPFLLHPGLPVTAQHLSMRPPAPSSLVAGVPPALDALVLQLLSKEPSARPGYADDVAETLATLGARWSPTLAVPPPRGYLYRPPFTGHAELLAFLEDELARAKQGRGRCVVLSGPSGSGKTRLATEVARAARDAGMNVLSGECAPFGTPDSDGSGVQSGPLQPFSALLHHTAARCQQDGPDATRRLLGAHCRVLEEYEPALAAVPGRDAYEPPPQLSARDAGERVQRSVVDVLTASSASTPILLIVDDAQWADDLSMGVLNILANAPPQPFHALVLVTCRSESRRPELEGLRTAPRALPLRLDPLTPADVGRVAAGMTAIEEMPGAFADFLAEQTGGTPFFVAEFLKAAVAEGLLIRKAGRWQLHHGTGDGASTPGFKQFASGALEALERLGSVDALLTRRLEGLERDAQSLVKAGAVLGREWDEALGAAVVGLGEERMLEAIEELLLRHILTETEGGTLRFAHDKIREAAYAANSPDELRAAHHRAAVVIETAAQGPGGEGVLARHYRLAGVFPKAFTYAERAGHQALRVGAFHEAREHLGMALELANMPGSGIALSLLERGQLLRRHGDALYGVGDLPGMERRFGEAVEVMGVARLPRSRLGWAALLMSEAGKQAVLRLLPARRAPTPGTRRDAMAEAAYALERLGEFHVYRDQVLEYLGTKVLAANLAERADAASPLAWVHVNMAVALTGMGLQGVAQHYLESSRLQARRTGELDTELYQLQIEGFVWSLRARWDASKRAVDTGFERSRAAGAAYRMEQLLTVSCITRFMSGDFAEAIEHAQVLGDSAAAGSRGLHQGFAHLHLGYNLLACGRHQEALRAIEAAEGFLSGLGVDVNRANCRASMAAIHLWRGDLDAAVQGAIQARSLLRGSPDMNMISDPFLRSVPAIYLAAWARALERRDESREVERQALEAIRSASRHARLYPAARSYALRHRALAARLRGQHTQSRHLLNQSVRVAAELRMPHDEACSWMELGRACNAALVERREALDRAAAIFDALGCEPYAERARQARGALQ